MSTNNAINKKTGGLTVTPTGTSPGETGEIKFQELTANGNNHVAIKAPNSLDASSTYTLPSALPTGNRVLQSDDTGQMSWVAGGGGGGGSLEDLADVTIVNPQPGEALRYDGSEWRNQTIPAAIAPRRVRAFDMVSNAYLDTSSALEYDNWLDASGWYATGPITGASAVVILNGDSKLYNHDKTLRSTETDFVSFPVSKNNRNANMHFVQKVDGTLWAWGVNSNGNLGLGHTNSLIDVPEQVGIDPDWKEIFPGTENGYAICFAIKNDGTLWAAGTNGNGITGQGATTGNTLVFTQIGIDTDWKAVSSLVSRSNNATAVYTAVGLKTDGTIWSWGSNHLGLTGLGTTSDNTLTPAQIGTDNDWESVHPIQYTGIIGTSPNQVYHSCFIAKKTDGTLWSWGSNHNGFTAQGITSGNTLAPAQIGTDNDWVKVSDSQPSTNFPRRVTALKANGAMWCWGGGSGSPVATVYSSPVRLGSELAMDIINYANQGGTLTPRTLYKSLGGAWHKINNNANPPMTAAPEILNIDTKNIVFLSGRSEIIITE